MIRAGLTGGIATGKSTVSKMLVESGIPVIDADRVSREIVAPGMPALSAIVSRFGPQVLDAHGALDRDALRAIVLSKRAFRKALS